MTIRHNYIATDETDTNPTARYQELRKHVKPLADSLCRSINDFASSIESEMPYKAQFLLECVIEELQKRV